MSLINSVALPVSEYLLMVRTKTLATVHFQILKQIRKPCNRANLQAQLTDAKQAMANRYTSLDAEKDFRIRDASILQLETRISSIEGIARSNREELDRLRSPRVR